MERSLMGKEKNNTECAPENSAAAPMVCGLLGEKLGHSLSPRIHREIFRLTGREGSYDLLECPPERVEKMLEECTGTFAGINVTIPYKVQVMESLDGLSPEAEAVGAVNTILFRDGRKTGWNTDYLGFGKMLERNGIAVEGKVAVVLGTGGAARAVVQYLKDHGATSVTAVSRSGGRFICPVISYEELAERSGDILVNCTPVGMSGHSDRSPVPESVVARFAAAVDLIYNPRVTPFLAMAGRLGKKAVDGMDMLVAQAVASQEIWQGKSLPDSLVDRIIEELEERP